MKALMIGGTGVISTSVTRRLLEQGWEVTLLNRGQHAAVERPFDGNVRQMIADINDEARVAELNAGVAASILMYEVAKHE